MTRKMVSAKKFENWGSVAEFINTGDLAKGTVMLIREFKNENGTGNIVCLQDDDDTKTSVFLGAALKFYNWEQYIGRYVLIEFLGLKKNDKTKRFYKDFNVSIEEEEDINLVDEDAPF